MPVLRKQNKHNNFVILDKRFFQDTSLSLQAKGLLGYLLSLPDNWEPRPSELVNHFKNGRHAIYSTITELKDAGYITSFQERSCHGKFSHHVYLVHEVPQDPSSEIPPEPQAQTLNLVSPLPEKPYTENPHTDNRYTEKPYTENQQLISNKGINNINKTNTTAIKTHRDTQSAQPQPTAVTNFSLVEPVIGKTLTKSQHQAVAQAAQELCVFCKDLRVEQLRQEIEFTLLYPYAFTQAGEDFSKKLNTIKKCIRAGTWRPPVSFNARKKGNLVMDHHCPDDHTKTLKAEIQRLADYRQVEIKVLHTSPMAKYPSFKAATHQRIDEYIKQIGELEKRLSRSNGGQKNVI